MFVFFPDICRICFRCKWNGFDAIYQDHTENEFSSIISHLPKEHDTLYLKFRESELHEETGRIGPIEQNVMKTLVLKMEKSL